MEPSTIETPSKPVLLLLRQAGADATHRHAAERILAIGHTHARGLRWKRISHAGSRPSGTPSFLHFMGRANGWDPDVVQLHLRWERPAMSPAVPELSFEASVGVYEYCGERIFHAPKALLREQLEPRSLNPDHLESLVCGELARMRQPLLFLRLVHAEAAWRLAPQTLSSPWPPALTRPENLHPPRERDVYRLIAQLISALNDGRILVPDP